MKITLPVAGLLLAACLLPVTGHAADNPTKAVAPSVTPANANETASMTTPKDKHATAAVRSNHPIDDSVITTKIKAKFIKDKQVRADNIEIKTLNGDVELFGTARTKAKAAHAVALARQVKGVKSVKSDIEIAAPDHNNTASSDKTPAKKRTAGNGSDQPVDDTWITTKVKARFVEDKNVSAANISVKTINGVVELSGTAKSMSESTKAAALAHDIKGVKSVRNDIKVN